MKPLQVITNRNIEIDPLSGIVSPIDKGTLLNMNTSDHCLLNEEKAFLNIYPNGRGLLLPYTCFNVLHHRKEYKIFLTESNNSGKVLYATENLEDRMQLLTDIQQRAQYLAKTKALKVTIADGNALKELIYMSEIQPLF